MDPKSHWEKVYRTRQPTEVSWYRAHLDRSLELIEEAAVHLLLLRRGGMNLA